MNITYDRYSMSINGRREFIRCGAMHYFRLPSQELWYDRLFKLKAAGYNAVDLYFCWGYHSPAPGQYDFTGIRDIRKLLKITQELGLYVIARPGPYINAEYSGGGFPGWLLAKKHLPLRNRREGAFEWSDEYMEYVQEWWNQIIPIINEAPNVLMVQIENEYATLDVEPEYMQALYDMTRELGVKVPLFHNDLYVAGLYEDIVDIYSFDNYSVTQFETDWREMPEIFQVLDNVENSLREFCQNRPLMAAELQAGWYGSWKGYKYETITELLGREHIGISTKSLLGQGLTIFNHYKAIGGTNWDYTGSVEAYTSYDFGAPISESGLNTARLFESKAINYFLQSFDLTATDRREAFPLSLSNDDCLYAVRSPIDQPDSAWLFLRNLTYEPRVLTVGERYTVTVKPFEVQILPYRIHLKSGYQLIFCTTEPLYQNEHVLVLKADRPITACIHSDEATPSFIASESSGVELLDSGQGFITFNCSELGARDWKQIQVGDLKVILLGSALVDTFWVEEEGTLIAGPEMRLLDGGYALAPGNHQWIRIAKDASSTDVQKLEGAASVVPPVLRDWDILDEAPELSGEPDFLEDFTPVSPNGLDFDSNALYEGSAWYRLPLSGPRPAQVEIDARHIWAVFLNGHCVGQGHHMVLIHGLDAPPPACIALPAEYWRAEGGNELLILVTGLGHPKGFHDDAQTSQGLLSLSIAGVPVGNALQIRGGLYSRGGQKHSLRANPANAPQKSNKISLDRLMAFESSPVVRMRTEFSLPVSANMLAPWGVKLQDVDYERIDIHLNDVLIGRYWRDCRCQELFYLPMGLLNNQPGNTNTLTLTLMNFEPFIERARLVVQPQQVTLQPYGVFTRTVPRSLQASQTPLHS